MSFVAAQTLVRELKKMDDKDLILEVQLEEAKASNAQKRASMVRGLGQMQRLPKAGLHWFEVRSGKILACSAGAYAGKFNRL